MKTSKKKIILNIIFFSLIVVPILVSAGQKFNTELKFGSRGSEVKLLQEELIKQGFLKNKATSYFGNDTKNALIKYQKKNSLKQTSKTDKATRGKLNKQSAQIATTPIVKNSQSSTANLESPVNNEPLKTQTQNQVDSKQLCVKRLTNEFLTLLNDAYKNSLSPATLQNQRIAMNKAIKALYSDFDPITVQEDASLTQAQRDAINSKNEKKITKQIDEVAYSEQKLNSKISSLYRMFDPYNIKLMCGQVSFEEQIVHELQELNTTFNKIINE